MKLPRILTLAVLAASLSAGAVSADPVLQPPTQWTTTYYYTNNWQNVMTGYHHSPCEGLPYWVGEPGPYEETVIGDC